MKSFITLVALFTTTQLFAQQDILTKVDRFLAADTYEEAFKCDDEAEFKTAVKGDKEPTFYHQTVIDCGEVTQIETNFSNEDTVETLEIDRAFYQLVNGNPLRITLSKKMFKHNLQEEIIWTSAQAIKVNYLGAKRNALKLIGNGVFCDDQDPSFCTDFSIELKVVQGVPYLARLADINLNTLGLDISTRLNYFNRK